MLRIVVAAFAGCLVLAGTAQAANITAQDPQSLVKALQDAGYKARLTKDENGEPYIESSSGGAEFALFLMNCTEQVDCRTIQFFAGFSTHKADLRKINEWNTNNRFGRAYLSDKGAARVEMDVDLDDGGLSPLLFEDNIEFWVAVLANFEKFISQESKTQ